MKPCSRCGVPKELSEFRNFKASKDGYRIQCKLCEKEWRKENSELLSERNRKWYGTNRGIVSERNRRWREENKEYRKKHYETNKERVSRTNKKYYEANRERRAKQSHEWGKANRDKTRSIGARRRSAKLNASPPWITSVEKAQIRNFYTLAVMQGEESGQTYHVDHIHPLKHPLICGLNVPANLQILEASVNCSKNNKFEPYIESECDFTELWQVRSDDRGYSDGSKPKTTRLNDWQIIKSGLESQSSQGKMAI